MYNVYKSITCTKKNWYYFLIVKFIFLYVTGDADGNMLY